MSTSGFFVTGTDTGVGKTVVSCALVRGLRSRGMRVGVMKPIETGVESDRPLDALALMEAAQSRDDIDDVCPMRFELPAAPSVAAAHAEREITLDPILDAFERARARHDLMVVEGAGGLMVPILSRVASRGFEPPEVGSGIVTGVVDRDLDMGGLAGELGLPLLVVARARLGTINHTLLTLREIEVRGLPLAGVVLSHAEGELTSADRANLGHLRAQLGTRLVGELEPIAEGGSAPEASLDLDRLIALVTEGRGAESSR
jgi:dethiobiotin synthetase